MKIPLLQYYDTCEHTVLQRTIGKAWIKKNLGHCPFKWID